MDKLNRANECVTTERCKINWLFFVDNLVLLVSSESSFRHALNSLAAACNIARMKVSSSKTEEQHLSKNFVQFSPQIGGVSSAEKYKYVGVVFTGDERQDEELNVRSDKVSAVMRALHPPFSRLKTGFRQKQNFRCLSPYLGNLG